MKGRTISFIIGAAILILAFGLGGYLLGRSGPAKGSKDAADGGRQAGAQQGQFNISSRVGELEARVAANPNDSDAAQMLADAYFEMKQFDKAILLYKKVLDKRPGSADTYNEIGLSLHYLGNSAEGLKYIDIGLKKNPMHQRMWLTKGFILWYGMGDLDGAGEAWKKAKSLDPNSPIGKAAADYLAQVSKSGR